MQSPVFLRSVIAFLLVSASLAIASSRALAAESGGMKKWQKGEGWGWGWSKTDEVGALNEMTDASRLAALRLVKQGKTYDLGVTYDRTSYKWPGHSPAEIISFRTPEGVKRQ